MKCTDDGQIDHTEHLPLQTKVAIAQLVTEAAMRNSRNSVNMWTGRKDGTLALWFVARVCEVADKRLQKEYSPTSPQGVRSRNSDNSLLRKMLAWEPKTKLRDGLVQTYPWIWTRLEQQGRAKPPIPRSVLLQ